MLVVIKTALKSVQILVGGLLLLALFYPADSFAQGAETQSSGLSGALPSPSPEVEIWQPSELIVLKLNLPATRLDLFVKDKLVKSYQVSIGMSKYPTPLRDFNISMIIWNPWWIPPDSDWAKDAVKTPPGPRNPLGVVKLIMERGIRIHGTNKPWTIGRARSHACLRMKNEEARELAWEIQKRYSEKTETELMDKYQRNRRRSYYVKLLESVPVITEYLQVERKGDRILLHPNRYWRRGFQEQLASALADQPGIEFDKKGVRKLNRLRRRKTIELSVAEVLAMVTLPPPISESGPHTDVLNQESAKAISAQ